MDPFPGYTVEAVMLAGVIHALDRDLYTLTDDDYRTLGYLCGLLRAPTDDEVTQARAIVELFQDGAAHVKGAREMVA